MTALMATVPMTAIPMKTAMRGCDKSKPYVCLHIQIFADDRRAPVAYLWRYMNTSFVPRAGTHVMLWTDGQTQRVKSCQWDANGDVAVRLQEIYALTGPTDNDDDTYIVAMLLANGWAHV